MGDSRFISDIAVDASVGNFRKWYSTVRGENILKYLASLVGMVFCVLIVRGFMLDGAEEVGWRMFWSELSRGNIDAIGQATGSATFAKVVIAAIVGLIAGGIVGERLGGAQVVKPAPVWLVPSVVVVGAIVFLPFLWRLARSNGIIR